MDTNSKGIIAAKRRGTYCHHPLALKRLIVEETLQPGVGISPFWILDERHSAVSSITGASSD